MPERAAAAVAQLESFGHELVVAVLNLELHVPQSVEVQETLAQLLADLRALVGPDDGALIVELGTHALTVGDHPCLGASLQARRLLDLAAERGVGALAFDRRLDADELLRFLQLFIAPHERAAFAPRTVGGVLAARGIAHVGVIPRADARALAQSGTQPQALRGYQDLANCLHETHVAARRGETIALDRAAGVVEQALAEMDREPSGLLALAQYDDIDSFTVGHSVRVALLTLQVARSAGASERTLLKAGTAALLHDIGKSRIPQSVLFKRGPLDQEEWRIMAMHPRLGAEILVEQKDIDPSAIGAAFCHHMSPGGGGYPKAALPFQPSSVSELVRVCDVFEALTSVRPYKPALTPVEAYVIMHRRPEDFAARWLRTFVDVIGLFPLGTRLELSTGELATVVGHGARRDQPRVRILANADGNAPPMGAPASIEVGTEVEGQVRTIRHVLPRSRRAEPEAPVDPAPAGKPGGLACC